MSEKLKTNFLNHNLINPFVLPSGLLATDFGTAKRAWDFGYSTITMKSTSLNPRKGHKNPSILTDYDRGYVLNAVGLTNPGIQSMLQTYKQLMKIKGQGQALIASIFGNKIQDYKSLCETIGTSADFIELNISCPNVHREGRMFSQHIQDVEDIIKQVKQISKVPIIVKLSPDVSNIGEIASVAEKAGADAICAINTIGAMSFDIYSKKPILTNGFGGLSGPCIKPIAIKRIYEIRQAVNIPIIGTGGVLDYKDVLEMICAGADLISIGSGASFREQGFDLHSLIKNLELFLEQNSYANLNDYKKEEGE